jgi:hypothetical protein
MLDGLNRAKIVILYFFASMPSLKFSDSLTRLSVSFIRRAGSYP